VVKCLATNISWVIIGGWNQSNQGSFNNSVSVGHKPIFVATSFLIY